MISLALKAALARSGDRFEENAAVISEAAAEGPTEGPVSGLVAGRRRQAKAGVDYVQDPGPADRRRPGRSASQAAEERVQQIARGECKTPNNDGRR